MTKSDEKTGPQPPRKKGGGDGSAKSAGEKAGPKKTGGDAITSADAAAEPATRNRKITTPRG
ncbi:MAG: hypothetical protein WCD76_16520 [Pyrinomonadaceae bacterium]